MSARLGAAAWWAALLLSSGSSLRQPPPLLAQEAFPTPGESAPVELVLDRRRRQLRVIHNGLEWRRYPVAIGRPGWETPVGRFRVLELVSEPIWVHPATGQQVAPGPANPLGSRWIGFLEDCRPRRGFNGQRQLQVRGCATAGFHGTPQRSSVGQAVSHGCVRLLDEHIRELFERVELGTPVTVLP
ncbi:MAG: L,D-transpeptidase [Cyanobacteriota bacterium]|nr:L,D-transpeptidase [Cyanobacteriota bacterium]